jgi:hypothetical protein
MYKLATFLVNDKACSCPKVIEYLDNVLIRGGWASISFALLENAHKIKKSTGI